MGRSLQELRAAIRGADFASVTTGPIYYWVFNYTPLLVTFGSAVPFYNGQRPAEFLRISTLLTNSCAVAIGSSQVDRLGNNTLDVLQPGDSLVIESEIESNGGLELIDAGQFYATALQNIVPCTVLITLASRDQRGGA